MLLSNSHLGTKIKNIVHFNLKKILIKYVELQPLDADVLYNVVFVRQDSFVTYLTFRDYCR